MNIKTTKTLFAIFPKTKVIVICIYRPISDNLFFGFDVMLTKLKMIIHCNIVSSCKADRNLQDDEVLFDNGGVISVYSQKMEHIFYFSDSTDIGNLQQKMTMEQK